MHMEVPCGISFKQRMKSYWSTLSKRTFWMDTWYWQQLTINVLFRFHCCGYANPEDRPILMSLLDNHPIITADAAVGCRDVIIDSLFHWKNWIIIGVVSLVTIKVNEHGTFDSCNPSNWQLNYDSSWWHWSVAYYWLSWLERIPMKNVPILRYYQHNEIPMHGTTVV